MSEGNQHKLARVSVLGLQWNYAGSAVRACCSIIINIVLARLLGPEPFGLIAIAWLVIGIGNLISGFGMGPALVQRERIIEEDIRYAFTIQIGMGAGLMIAVFLSAPAIAYFFNDAKVVAVVQAMSLVFILQTLGVIARSLLARELDFKGVQLAQIGSYVIGYVGLGVPLAFLGFHVWSLVYAQLVQTALNSIFCYAQVRHSIKPLFSSSASGLADFGSKVMLTNIVNWTINSLDSFFIGRFFDAFVLGLYNRASTLVMTPMENLVMGLQRVAFSSYSRMQNDLEALRRVYLATVGFMAMLTLPIFVCVALIPETIIQGLYGHQWRAAIPLIVPLALAMPFHAVMAINGPVLWARDRVGQEFLAQLSTAIVLPLVLLIAAKISVAAVAWGMLGAAIFRFIAVTHMSLKSMELSWSSLLSTISGGLILLIPAAGMVLVCDQATSSLVSSTFLRLTVDILATGGFVLAVVMAAPKLIFSPAMLWLCTRVKPLLPTLVRPLMNRMTLLVDTSA